MENDDARLAVFYDPKVREKLNSHRPSFCAGCPIQHCTLGYVPPKEGSLPQLIVGEAAGEEEALLSLPFVGGAGTWLKYQLRAAGSSIEHFHIINTLGCRPPLNVYPTSPEWSFTSRADGKEAVEYCAKHHLLPYVKGTNWTRIIALGNQALTALTPRTGIETWRGSPLPLKWDIDGPPRVIPTIHPAALMRDSKLASVCASVDLRRMPVVPPENYNLEPSVEDVRKFVNSDLLSFDFEWDMSTGDITLCGLSNRVFEATVVPFVEPYISELKRVFESAKALVGHNIIGADTRYFSSLGWDVKAELLDTMLMQHLLQPDYPHSLSFVASVFTGKVFWKGTGSDEEEDVIESTGPRVQWKTFDSPLGIPVKHGGYKGCSCASEAFRLYNARDTDATLQAYYPIRTRLDRYGQMYVYENVSRPIAFLCRDMSDGGLKIDHTKLDIVQKEINAELAEIEAKLPEPLRPYVKPVNKHIRVNEQTAPWKPATRVCKGKKSLRTQHDPHTIVFTEPVEQLCPVCGATVLPPAMHKVKVIVREGSKVVRPWNSSAVLALYAKEHKLPTTKSNKGNVKTDKYARLRWSQLRNEFLLVDKAKILLTRRNSFAKSKLRDIGRVYFSFKPHGTSEGRLSCSGKRRGIDPNIQNQPKFIKSIFIPDSPELCFVNVDYIQGENMLTAHIAGDVDRLARLRTPGYDEHAEVASQAFKVNVVKGGENSDLRHLGKVVNHGKNYGLKWKTALNYIHSAGYTSITAADVKEMFAAWERLNGPTAAWQENTIGLVRAQGFLENAFKRRRWFQTRNYATQALAFLPASTLADIMLRSMIAFYPNRFPREIENLQLSVAGEMPGGWVMKAQIHDSLLFQGPYESLSEMVDLCIQIMCQPWKELDGFRLGVEVEVAPPGKSWGECVKYKVHRPWIDGQ